MRVECDCDRRHTDRLVQELKLAKGQVVVMPAIHESSNPERRKRRACCTPTPAGCWHRKGPEHEALQEAQRP